MEGLFQPIHMLIIFFSAVTVFGAPFLAGFFLGRYVELRKSKTRESDASGPAKKQPTQPAAAPPTGERSNSISSFDQG